MNPDKVIAEWPVFAGQRLVDAALLSDKVLQPSGQGRPGGTLLLLAVVLVAGYLLWCAAYPWKACPRCAGKSTAGDRKGNYRVRRSCWRCRGERYPRVGTRLLRAFGFRPRS